MFDNQIMIERQILLVSEQGSVLDRRVFKMDERDQSSVRRGVAATARYLIDAGGAVRVTVRYAPSLPSLARLGIRLGMGWLSGHVIEVVTQTTVRTRYADADGNRDYDRDHSLFGL